MSALARKRRHTDLPTPSVERKVDARIAEAQAELEMLREFDAAQGHVRFALAASCPKLLATFDAWQAAKGAAK